MAWKCHLQSVCIDTRVCPSKHSTNANTHSCSNSVDSPDVSVTQPVPGNTQLKFHGWPSPWAVVSVVLMGLSSPAFTICWSPYFLFDILDNFNLLPDTKERFYASVIIQNLPALNSAINPLIYCIFNRPICFPCRYRVPSLHQTLFVTALRLR